MFWPIVLLFLSLAGLGAAFALPGWSDLVLIAGPTTVASLYLLLRAAQGQHGGYVVLDGSNVMYWRGDGPDVDAVRDVLAHARRLGLTPGVVFDANAGHLLFGRYADDAAFAQFLKLRGDRALVVPKGEPADATILEAARSLRARIITNDKYRDWVEEFPELNEPGLLIPGGYRDGKVWLDVTQPSAKAKRRPKGRRSKAS